MTVDLCIRHTKSKDVIGDLLANGQDAYVTHIDNYVEAGTVLQMTRWQFDYCKLADRGMKWCELVTPAADSARVFPEIAAIRAEALAAARKRGDVEGWADIRVGTVTLNQRMSLASHVMLFNGVALRPWDYLDEDLAFELLGFQAMPERTLDVACAFIGFGYNYMGLFAKLLQFVRLRARQGKGVVYCSDYWQRVSIIARELILDGYVASAMTTPQDFLTDAYDRAEVWRIGMPRGTWEVVPPGVVLDRQGNFAPRC